MFQKIKIDSIQATLLDIEENASYIDSRIDLLPDSLLKAAKGRIREFLAGRICAESIFQELGHNNLTIGRAENREPLWPQNFVGSISHTKKFAICSIASKNKIKSVGIDIEKLIPQERFDSIAKLVTTELDKFYLKDCNSKDLQLVQSILFSGKESLYKAIFPYFKQYFGFQEASLLEVDLKNQEFTLQINSESELRKFNGKYQGKYNLIQDHLLTSIVLKYTE